MPTAQHVYDWKRDSTKRLRTHRMFTAPKGILAYDPIDLRSKFSLPPRNQSNLGACTGFGICGVDNFERARLGLPVRVGAELFVYYNERQIEGTAASDSGATITDGITAYRQFGICDEQFDPYVIENFANQPSPEAYADAKNDMVTNAEQVSQDLDSLYACLAAGHVIVFGFDVYESFESDAVASTGMVPMPNTSTENLLGGHCVVICGRIQINGDWYWIVRNSWGTGWGDGGYFYLPEAYVLSDMCSDFWVVKQIQISQPLPAPSMGSGFLPLNILVVSGFLEHVGDSSQVWKIADALTLAGHKVTRRAWTDVSIQDLVNVDIAITYSWGTAMFHKRRSDTPADKRSVIHRHFILAGVPCIYIGQFLSSWTEDTAIETAVDFDVKNVWPSSIPMDGVDHSYTLDQLPPFQQPAMKLVNVDCSGSGVDHFTLPTIAAPALLAEITIMAGG